MRLFGLVLGWVVYRLLARSTMPGRSTAYTRLEAGGYSLASRVHVSGPIAMVVAGIWIGNLGRKYAMSDSTVKNLDSFWELVDVTLNAILFALIGLEVLVLNFSTQYLLLGLLVIAAVLVGPLSLLRYRFGCLSNAQGFLPGRSAY